MCSLYLVLLGFLLTCTLTGYAKQDVLLHELFTSTICIFYSVEEYLKDSSAPISAPCLKQHLLKQCNNQKLIDNPEAMPFLLVDYLINREEQDSMREEDWKKL